MLMRQLQLPIQLQRPLTRPLAAAWRPAQFLVTAGGSAKRGFAASPTVWSGTEQIGDSAGPGTTRPSSLFAELFPDEAKRLLRAKSNPDLQKSAGTDGDNSFTKPPPRTLSPLPQSEHPLISYYEDSSHHPASASAENCTVVLSATTKYLVPSDFYRVGAGKAAHVEGWVGGITKVIQARDPDTLEPLGRYYVTFGTAAAAAAWQYEVRRLWQLSRDSMPGVVRRNQTKGTADFSVGTSNAAAGTVEELEAARREVSGFALVPPGLPWSLEMAKYTAEERAVEHAGSLVDKLCRKAKTKFLVMVAVSRGRISPETLRSAIREDGQQRALPWRIRNLEADVGDETWGIMPFGKSGLKMRDQASMEEDLKEQGNRAMGDEWQQDRSELTIEIRDEARKYPRFLVPFLDEAEARRFVRGWHRRELTLKMGHNDAATQSVKQWDESRVLSVTLLW